MSPSGSPANGLKRVRAFVGDDDAMLYEVVFGYGNYDQVVVLDHNTAALLVMELQSQMPVGEQEQE